MPVAKLSKKAVDALVAPKSGQQFVWDTETKGFGVRIGSTGAKSYVIQYANAEGRLRRVKIGRHGVLTVEQARDQAKIKLASVLMGDDPAEERRHARKDLTVAELCDWYLTEARGGSLLGRRHRPIKESTLLMDESRIRAHIKPLLGARIARRLTIADVEQMQANIAAGKTARGRPMGRGGRTTGGAGAGARSVATLQAIMGHARHKGVISEHHIAGVRKLTRNKRTRRLSAAEIQSLGKAMAFAEQRGENLTGLAVLRLLLLTGFRREEAQKLKRAWVNDVGGYVAFPDTKSGAQVRAISKHALNVIERQPQLEGNSHVFPASVGEGPFTSVSITMRKVCAYARLMDVTPHTLRHTFGSMAGELGFSELTIRAMLGHASQSITQDYVHIDEAVKLAVDKTAQRISELLDAPAMAGSEAR
jgi:integrase